MLVNVVRFRYPDDFMIIDRGDLNMPIIFGAPFLAMAKAQTDYESSTIWIKRGRE